MPSCNRYYAFRQVPVSVTNFSFSLTVTIGGLSEEVLLNIFCYYLDTSPRLWPRLAHFVADGDASYLCLNELYDFDCSVLTERLW